MAAPAVFVVGSIINNFFDNPSQIGEDIVDNLVHIDANSSHRTMKRIPMFKTKSLASAVMFGMALAAAAVAQESKITIGLYGPLTGPSAVSGQSLRNGAQVAVDQINASGGLLGRQLSLIEYDDRSSPEQALRAATKLVQVDHVDAIIGSIHSGNIQVAGPVVEAAKTPLVGAGTSPTWLQQGYTFFFRALGNGELSTAELAKYAKAKGWTKIAIIHSNDEYGNSGAALFEATVAGQGGKVVANQSFTHGDRDFTGQIGRIASGAPDALFVWALADDLGALTKQVRQLGFPGPILGAEGYAIPEVVKMAGATSDGVLFASQYLVPDSINDTKDPEMRAFLERYQSTFKKLPVSDASFRGYDAVMVIAEGIRRARSTDGTAVRDAIRSIREMKGLAGVFDYVGGKGEGIHSVRLFAIKDGKFLPAN
jgi:branched-chain amino acid transport system substrate-binding protein